jgi:hypothetical protein
LPTGGWTKISTLIGEEEVTKACKEAKQAFAKGVDQRAWKIFTERTQDERERFQQEVQEKLAREPKGRKRAARRRGWVIPTVGVMSTTINRI